MVKIVEFLETCSLLNKPELTQYAAANITEICDTVE